jgi:hypothetical protein
MLYWVEMTYGYEEDHANMAIQKIVNVGLAEADTQWESILKSDAHLSTLFNQEKKKAKMFSISSKPATPGPVFGCEVDFILFKNTEGESVYPDFTLKLNAPIDEIIHNAICENPDKDKVGRQCNENCAYQMFCHTEYPLKLILKAIEEARIK